jgi:high-affinity iron transporter
VEARCFASPAPSSRSQDAGRYDEAALSPDAASGLSTFLGSATILLREGLEALLIIVAMVAFLRKAERMEVMPYVHAGWVGALVAGFLTWVVATWVLGISGASRELTEGFGSVFAAVVLLSVGRGTKCTGTLSGHV